MMFMNVRLPIICCCAAMFYLLCGSSAHAELLVIPSDNGYTTPSVLRFDERTGTFIDQFGQESEGYEGMAQGPDNKIYVTGNTLGSGDVYRFNRNGQYLGPFTGAGLQTPGGLTFGPDTNCYVLCSNWPQSPSVQQVWRYNGLTGAFMDKFILDAGAPRALLFGPDDLLYVSDGNRGIVRYGSTGALLDTFVPLGRGGLRDAQTFLFGPDGNLYLASLISNAVARFSGTNGMFLDYVVAPGSGGLSQPGGLAFGPDGNLYVSSTATHQILRFHGRTGAFLDVFAMHPALKYPTSLTFIPPLPRLAVKHAGQKVEISWPSSSPPQDWTLVSRKNIDPPGVWNIVTNGLAIVGTNCVVTDRCNGSSTLYRLAQR